MTAAVQHFDATRPHRLNPEVALRPEAFGALAYHYGNRRLVFLKSDELVELVRSLEHHRSPEAAIRASTADHGGDDVERRRRSLATALSSLAAAGVICER